MELQISSQSSKPTFTLVPKSKKEVNTIAKWIKAFNCFTAVYSRKWPEEVPGLLKHMEVVIGLSDDNANWRSYDISFRKLHANGLERFGQINIDLYLTASRGPFQGSVGRFGDNKDGKSGKGGAQERLARHPLIFCFNFHNGRKCTGCNFKHSCYKCNESAGCPIAQRPSQLPVEREVLLKSPNTPVKSKVYARTHKVQKPYHHVKRTKEVKADF